MHSCTARFSSRCTRVLSLACKSAIYGLSGPSLLVTNNWRAIYAFPPIIDASSLYYYPQNRATTYAAFANRHNAIILPEYEPSNITGCYKHLRKFVRHPNKWTRQYYIDQKCSTTFLHQPLVSIDPLVYTTVLYVIP